MKNKTNICKLLGRIFTAVGIGMTVLGLFFMNAFRNLEDNFGLLFGGIWALDGVLFFLIGLGLLLACKNSENRKRRLLEAGRYIMADIVKIDLNRYQVIQMGSRKMHPYFIVCSFIDGTGKEYTFKSRNLFFNPEGLLRGNQLKVYVDLQKPRKYYVDTNDILPEDAVLHKWKIDTGWNSGRVMAEGNYVNATTCGVERFGKVLGYTILCRYDAPNGIPHIFASRMIYGEPQSDYLNQPIRVYYSGKEFKKYHVDVRSLGIVE